MMSGFLDKLGIGGEGGHIAALGQQVPQGVSFAGPTTPMSGAESSLALGPRPYSAMGGGGIPGASTTQAFAQQGAAGAPGMSAGGNPSFAGLLGNQMKSPGIQGLIGGLMGGGKQAAPEGPKLNLPQVNPIPLGAEPDALAWMRAFSMQ